MSRTEERLRRNLGARIELQAVSREAPQHLDSTPPAEWTGATRTLGPFDRKGHAQVLCRSEPVGKAGKRDELGFIDTKREPMTAPIGQVRLDSRDPGHGGTHDVHPGHGIATARRPTRSTRA